MDCSGRLVSPILQGRRRGLSMGTSRRSLPSLWISGRSVFLARCRVLGLGRVVLGTMMDVSIVLERRQRFSRVDRLWLLLLVLRSLSRGPGRLSVSCGSREAHCRLLSTSC